MKNTKTITITIESGNNKAQIRLPENYDEIFEKASKSVEHRENKLYNRFVKKFLGLHEFEREMFEDIAASGKHPTETIKDLFGILKERSNYFIIQNAETYEQIGSIYASMNRLEYRGPKVPDMSVKYTELGVGVCDMYDGFFARGRFYGRMD